MRISPQEYLDLDLEVHGFLADVPLHDVRRVDLPGGGEGRTISDVSSFISEDSAAASSTSVAALFALRRFLGTTFGWDGEGNAHPKESYLRGLTEEQRARSLAEPGSKEGPFQIVYEFPRELLSEIRNATVHAFSCMVLRPTQTGYSFYWAIYVKPVSRLTPFYMALIDPFRRFLVYPRLLRTLRGSWMSKYGV